jgi:hypothetical protein
MPINFPSSPSLNSTYTYLNRTWIWTGQAWKLTPNPYRNIFVSTADPSGGVDGDIWIKYTA